ncbi:MAG: cyclic nucleotide-binding domain-containing protein [Cytophagales bacterium]
MKNPFGKSYGLEELNFFRFLSKINLFKYLNNDDLAHLVPYLHQRKYKKDEVVFFRGDPSQALYIVKSGKVSLNIDIGEKFETLTNRTAGSCFGDNSLLAKSERIYNAIVESEHCELYVIPQINILDLFEKKIEIKAKMLQALAESYYELNQNLYKSYKSSFGFFELSNAFDNIS